MPKEAYGLTALLAGIAAAFFLVTYSGPYRILSDLQVALFHTNLVALSFLLTMVLLCAPLFLLVWAGERRWGTRVTWLTPVWANLDHIFDLLPGKLLLVGLTLLVMGGYFWSKDLGRGPLVPLSVKALEDGHPPAGTYVELADGRLMEEADLTFQSDSTIYRYIPVVDHGEAVSLFLRIPESDRLQVRRGNLRGILDENGMEGELASRLEARHLLARPYYVLGVGRVPDPRVGGWMAGIGAALSLAGILWWRTAVGPT